MIIKTRGYKRAGYRRKIEYLHDHDMGDGYFVSHNFPVLDLSDQKALVDCFMTNYRQYVPTRKNGNVMIEDIVSLKRVQSIPIEEQINVLMEISQRYIEKYRSEQMCYGVVHLKAHHLHCHIVLAPNRLNTTQKVRVTPRMLYAMQKEMETWTMKQFPQLNVQPIYNAPRLKRRARVGDKEYFLKQRTKSPTKKEKLAAELIRAFADPDLALRSKLEAHLHKHGIQLYQRGQAYVAQVGAMKCRLRTLGVEDSFLQWLKRSQRLERLTPSVYTQKQALVYHLKQR